MGKYFNFRTNPQLEVFGFAVAAALSIPALIVCAFGVYHLLMIVF